MAPLRAYERVVIDRFEFRGLNGRPSVCALEILPCSDEFGRRTVVVATELQDNRGTSVTNAAEYLASYVCDLWSIAPDTLVWIEHYGYGHDRTFDRVTFQRRKEDTSVKIQWAPAVLNAQPSGWPGYFQEPDWHPMAKSDWWSLGLPPR